MNRSYILIACITALLTTAIAPAAQAQPAFALQSDNGYTSNAFANHLALPDYFSTLGARINQDWLSEAQGLRAWYEGSLTAFRTYGARNSHTHELGLSWYHLLSEQGHRIDAGISSGARFHSDSYQLYEQQHLQLHASLKYLITPQWFAYLGWSWTWRSYPELVPFSHTRELVYARSSWFFNTGTSLIAEANWLGKSYTAASTSPHDNYADVVTTGDGRSSQLLLTLRLAQGVTSRIGLNAEFQRRHNLATASRYLGSAEGYYYSDEELFADYFAYSGNVIQLGYRHQLPLAMRFSLGLRREQRAFADRPAADLLGNPFPDGRLRDDRRTSLWLEWEKKLKVKSAWQPLALQLSLSWLNNRSNDLWYNYSSRYIGLGIGQDF